MVTQRIFNISFLQIVLIDLSLSWLNQPGKSYIIVKN